MDNAATPTPANDCPAFDRWLSLDLQNRYTLSDPLPGELLSLIDAEAVERRCN